MAIQVESRFLGLRFLPARRFLLDQKVHKGRTSFIFSPWKFNFQNNGDGTISVSAIDTQGIGYATRGQRRTDGFEYWTGLRRQRLVER